MNERRMAKPTTFHREIQGRLLAKTSRDIVIAAATTPTHVSRLNQPVQKKGERDKTKEVTWNLYRRAQRIVEREKGEK